MKTRRCLTTTCCCTTAPRRSRCRGRSAPQGATGFPQRCAQWLLDGAREFGAGTDTALDVGCAVGRASFELARGYREVIGVDLSRAFVDAAQAVQRTGELAYFRKDEGELGAELSATIDPAIDRSAR